MDAQIKRCLMTYKLVNRENGNVEAEKLGRVSAMDKKNRLWALGIKTNVVEEN